MRKLNYYIISYHNIKKRTRSSYIFKKKYAYTGSYDFIFFKSQMFIIFVCITLPFTHTRAHTHIYPLQTFS